MKKRRVTALLMAMSMAITGLAGCGQTTKEEAKTGTGDAQVQTAEERAGENGTEGVETADSGEKVNIKLFTGKIETIDVMNEIIEDFNQSQDRITVEQEYQKDASNIIKIKFASDEVPDIMTTYEQGFVDEGKYMDLSDQEEWWSRMSPDMKTACIT